MEDDNPRKKVKTFHHSIVNPLASQPAKSNHAVMSALPPQPQSSDDRDDKENACGISEFVSLNSASFSGILKKRYTDFLVNEILLSGEVVHLKDLRAPVKPEDKPEHGSKSSWPANEQHEKHPTPSDHKNATESDRKPAGVSFSPEATGKKANADVQDVSKVRSAHEPRSSVNTSAYPDQTSTATGGARGQPDLISYDGTAEIEKVLGAPQDSLGDLTFSETQQQQPNPSLATKLSAPGVEGQRRRPFPTGLDGVRDPFRPPHERGRVDPLTQHFEISPPPAAWMKDAPRPRSEDSPRKRYKVLLHMTDDGWKELMQEEQSEWKVKQERETAERKANGNDRVKITPGIVYSPEKRPAPRPDGLSSWNAFAGTKLEDRSQISDDDRSILEGFFTTEVIDAMRSLYNRILASPDQPPRSYGSVRSAQIDRQTRGRIHQEIRRIFGGKLDSSTDDEGHLIIGAMPKQSSFPSRDQQIYHHQAQGHSSRRKAGKPPRQIWSELGGDFLHFTLYKENKDTMAAIAFLSKYLKNKPKDFHFAGTKDRRGVTVQRACVYRIQLKALVAAGKSMFNAALGDFVYRPNKMQLGDLAGNEFAITLRDCKFNSIDASGGQTEEAASETVRKSVTALNNNGFINYYGLQRFGTFGFSTDSVGVSMLRGDFNAAVNGILSFKPACLEPEAEDAAPAEAISRDDRARAQAINIFVTTGDQYRALDCLPRNFNAESILIRHLSHKGQQNDYLGALKMIPRNNRLMYVHAYQSLVWNFAASERLRRFGRRVVEGDLVIVDKSREGGQQDGVDGDGDVVIHAAEEDRSSDPDDMFTRARCLTKVEAESGEYTIFDIILPTPGFDVIYPANEIGEFYRIFMGSERGGGLDPYDMRRTWKDISLSGSYRKFVARPLQDITFEIKTYTDDNEQFLETDLERYYKDHPEEAKCEQQRKESQAARNQRGRHSQDIRRRQVTPPPKEAQNATVDKNEVDEQEPLIPIGSGKSESSGGGAPLNPAAAWFAPTSKEDTSGMPPPPSTPQKATMSKSGSSPPLNPSAPSFKPTTVPSDLSPPNASFLSSSTDNDDGGGVSLAGYPRAMLNEIVKSKTKEEKQEKAEEKADEKIAVILKMQLGSSTYATMALRELMKGGVRTWKGDYGGGR